MTDEPRGIFAKYEVTKQGVPVFRCFVLRYDRDPAARLAMLTYADAVRRDNPELANDIVAVIGPYINKKPGLEEQADA